ncbi:MAG: class I SAM-dependent methyltransferase [Clostridiaceae bacterium]
MGDKGLFNINSQLYSKARPQYPKELYEYLNSISSEHKSAWDCACGNGQVAKDLIKYFDRVFATDISENQIKNALKDDGIEYSLQSSEATSFQDNTFDLICVAQALHWFDYNKFWAEVKRVLKKDGIFAAFGYSWFSIEKEIDLIIKDEVLDKISCYWAPQNKILWDKYHDVDFPFIKLETPNFNMIIEYDLNQLFDYMKSWSATRLCIEENGEDFYVNAYKRVKEVWGNCKEKKKVNMDFCVLIGVNK